MSFMKKLFGWLFKPIELKDTPMSVYEQTIMILESIDPESMKSVFSFNLSMYTVETIYYNVEEYTKQLKHLTTRILNNKDYVLTNLYGLKHIYVREFFLSKDKHYIDVVESFVSFREASKQFLSLYNSIDEKTKKSPFEEKTLTQNYFVVNNLCNLIKDLSNVQENKGSSL